MFLSPNWHASPKFIYDLYCKSRQKPWLAAYRLKLVGQLTEKLKARTRVRSGRASNGGNPLPFITCHFCDTSATNSSQGFYNTETVQHMQWNSIVGQDHSYMILVYWMWRDLFYMPAGQETYIKKQANTLSELKSIFITVFCPQSIMFTFSALATKLQNILPCLLVHM